MPNVIILAGGAFGRWLCHKGGTLVNRISACMKETPGAPLPSDMWGHTMNMTYYEPRSTYSPDTKSSIPFILDSPAPDLWEVHDCCINHPVYVIFVIAAWID